ncbi:MAG TPA: GNAT family N-acetyltransferase [Kofleriaceae bacterium]
MDLRLSRESQRFHVPLRTGETLTVAALRPSDEPRLRAWFQRVSPDSRYQRFHVHVTDLTDEDWRYLTSVDGVDHVALVASLAGEPVAVARLIALPGDAELAFLVDDAHQRRGIGSVLRDALIAIARERGIYRLHAHVLPDNVAIRRLLSTPSLHVVGDRGHVIELVLAAHGNYS